jgi:hypothetical protein
MEEVESALELAAGMRLRSGIDAARTASKGDIAVTRKQILLFLESLDADLTVGEIREHLEN